MDTAPRVASGISRLGRNGGSDDEQFFPQEATLMDTTSRRANEL